MSYAATQEIDAQARDRALAVTRDESDADTIRQDLEASRPWAPSCWSC